MSNTIKIRKGLNIPLAGAAEKIVHDAPRAPVYAVKPTDFHGLTPKMLVHEGDRVKAGTPLFYDKYQESMVFVSPVSGVFKNLVRGAKRRILEVQIEPDSTDDYLKFDVGDPASLSRDDITALLLKAGLWPLIRQRPYSVIAKPGTLPKGIFISAYQTAPLAADPDFIIKGNEEAFQKGLDVLARLTEGDVHLSIGENQTQSPAFLQARGVRIHRFSGPHPAGNVGIQIHHIDPLNKGETVWYTEVQGVIMIGRLFEKGVYDASRLVALTGPEVMNPRYYRCLAGARVDSFAAANLRRSKDTNQRIISGDALTGTNIGKQGFLGFYDTQLTVLPEGDKPELLGWLIPRPERFSVSRTFPGFLMPGRKYKLDTMVRSGERPFVITGLYERYLPMDILPMALLKSIMINDIDMMEKLGIYEVAPEDFALCEYVCPSKIEIQQHIRDGLDSIMREFA